MYKKYFNDKNDENQKYLFTELSEKYLDQTAALLNNEWPRSLSQRVLSLKSTFRNSDLDKPRIPVCLVIIDLLKDQVIGHASLVSITTISDVEGPKNLAFLQSVLIDKSLRGRGLGKILINLSEAYLTDYSKVNIKEQKTNCDFIYLNTKDRQTFYERLGYIRIEPIQFYTNKDTKCNQIMKNLMTSMNKNIAIETSPKETGLQKCVPSTSAPQPPPLPALSNVQNNKATIDISWYKKSLRK